MRIAFVIANAYGMGGTIRAVFNLAEGLSARHEVEIISLVRHRDAPFFRVPDGVTLRALSGTGDAPGEPSGPRGPAQRLLARRGLASLVSGTEAARDTVFTVRSAVALRRYLRSTRADAVIGTRPGVNLLLALWAPPHVLAIGQEHVNLGNHTEELRAAITDRYPRLDGMTVLTEADRDAYLDELDVSPDWLTAMPNPLPAREYPRSTQDNPIIVAAGRLTPVKQYPKLLQAFADVARGHPEWRLRIYGGGKKDRQLRAKIVEMGLSNQVALMGRTKDLTGELAKASLLAVSSRVEGFGMTIVEGFSVGVPAVSFDCPHGPREIIEDGRNGLLVPDQDVNALAAGLLRLVENREERLRMGQEAVRSAARYDMGPIVERWEAFLRERLAARAAGRGGERARRSTWSAALRRTAG